MDYTTNVPEISLGIIFKNSCSIKKTCIQVSAIPPVTFIYLEKVIFLWASFSHSVIGKVELNIFHVYDSVSILGGSVVVFLRSYSNSHRWGSVRHCVNDNFSVWLRRQMNICMITVFSLQFAKKKNDPYPVTSSLGENLQNERPLDTWSIWYLKS